MKDKTKQLPEGMSPWEIVALSGTPDFDKYMDKVQDFNLRLYKFSLPVHDYLVILN
jgi:hypothetical protein